MPAEDVGLQYFRYTAPQFFPERRLPEYSVVCCFTGGIDFWENNLLTSLRPGEIMIGNAGMTRGSRYVPQNGPCEGATAVIGSRTMRQTLAALRREYGGPLPRFVGKIADQHLKSQFMHAAAMLRQRPSGIGMFLQGCLRQLLVEVLWKWPPPDILPGTIISGHLLPRKHFVLAVEYMNRCAKHEFTVETLCEEIGMSLAHYRRLLYASTGHRPLDFYNRVLARRAEGLLQGSQPVHAVSKQLGFPSHSQFCKLFRRLNGCSPSEFQAMNQRPVANQSLSGSIHGFSI